MKKIIIFLLVFVGFSQVSLAKPFEDFKMPFESDQIEGMNDFSPENNDGKIGLENTAYFLIDKIRVLIGFMAFLYITYYGYLAVFSPEENLAKAKNSIINGTSVLLFSFLVEPIIKNVIYGSSDGVLGLGQAVYKREISVSQGMSEIMAVLSYLEMIVGFVAVFMIIFTGVKIIFDPEAEDALETQKKNVLWIIVGVILLLLNEVLVRSGVYGIVKETEDGKIERTYNSWEIILEASSLVKYLMSFLGLIAFVLFVIGGFKIIFSQEESAYEEGIKLIKNVLIGSLIILLSYTIVSTVILFNT
jgi:hypothetical protein